MLFVAVLTGMGTAPIQLAFHIRTALNLDVGKKEIVEIFLQMAVYAGVPACMNGVAAARQAFES